MPVIKPARDNPLCLNFRSFFARMMEMIPQIGPNSTPKYEGMNMLRIATIPNTRLHVPRVLLAV